MATKLQLYNTALRYCKSRKTTLTENREPRRLLDDVYESGGVDFCLESAQWKFCTRSVRLDYDAAETRQFGFLRAFSKPTDWKKTVSLCSDEYYSNPLTQYHHEGAYWYADLDEIYVRYISNDAAYGYDLSKWPASFLNYVAAHFANEIVRKVSGGDKDTIAEVKQILKENKLEASSNDAWNQPTAFPAPGSWVRSRRSGRRSSNDGGNTGSLIG